MARRQSPTSCYSTFRRYSMTWRQTSKEQRSRPMTRGPCLHRHRHSCERVRHLRRTRGRNDRSVLDHDRPFASRSKLNIGRPAGGWNVAVFPALPAAKSAFRSRRSTPANRSDCGLRTYLALHVSTERSHLNRHLVSAHLARVIIAMVTGNCRLPAEGSAELTGAATLEAPRRNR
jgi:hypothetical protein